MFEDPLLRDSSGQASYINSRTISWTLNFTQMFKKTQIFCFVWSVDIPCQIFLSIWMYGGCREDSVGRILNYYNTCSRYEICTVWDGFNRGFNSLVIHINNYTNMCRCIVANGAILNHRNRFSISSVFSLLLRERKQSEAASLTLNTRTQINIGF